MALTGGVLKKTPGATERKFSKLNKEKINVLQDI